MAVLPQASAGIQAFRERKIRMNVIVTGSSRGIGLAIAEKFSANGANVAINCSSDAGVLNSALKKLREFNDKTIAVQADVSTLCGAQRLFSEVGSKLGEIDVLVNNAGSSLVGLFNELQPGDWNPLIQTNIVSVLNCCRLALPAMLKKRKGVILNISSVWGESGASCEAVYSLTKGAVNAFTKALGKESAPNGVRVNAIACGAFETRMNSFLTPEDRELLENQIPAGRFGRPEEAAELAYFMCSDSASYMNGQIVTLDGAWI